MSTKSDLIPFPPPPDPAVSPHLEPIPTKGVEPQPTPHTEPLPDVHVEPTGMPATHYTFDISKFFY